MKKAVLLAAILAGGIASYAQTDITTYQPGVSTEGAVYYLPKTVINVNLTIEKTSYNPGELCQYADRYLRISNISDKEDVQYKIAEVTLTTEAMPDEKKLYHILFTGNSIAPLVHLDESGILLGINTDAPTPSVKEPTQPVAQPKILDPQSYLTEEMLMVGSKAKMAELIAKEIYDIRESKNLLLRGQNDNMPKDGEALKIILEGMNEQEQAFMQLFTGTVTTEVTTHTFQVIPDGEADRALLGRFSRKLGLLHKDDLGGTPIYIDIKNRNSVPEIVIEDTNKKKSLLPKKDSKKKKEPKQDGLVYNLPGKADVKVYNNTSTLAEAIISLPQFGYTETLSSSLFSKKKNVKVVLDPHTGALLKVEE